MYVFNNRTAVRKKIDDWMKAYNEERSHDSLNNRISWEYLVKFKQQKNSNLHGT